MVVGLASTTCKDNLARRALEKLRYLLPCMLNGLFGRDSCPVLTGGVTIVLRKKWSPRFNHLRSNRGTSIEIEGDLLIFHENSFSILIFSHLEAGSDDLYRISHLNGE